MSATVTAAVVSQLNVVSTFSGYASPLDNTLTVSGMNESLTLTASTTPPVTKQTSFQQALSSGSATVNLAALPGLTAEETVNLTGLKVQALKLRNLSTNANSITVAKGASNGHTLLGSSWTVTLQPGQSHLYYFNNAAPTVASGDRTIDLTGTGAQVLEVQLVAG